MTHDSNCMCHITAPLIAETLYIYLNVFLLSIKIPPNQQDDYQPIDLYLLPKFYVASIEC